MNRTLRRSPSNKVIAGVCGGLGEFFGIDPVIVRIIFAVLTLPGFIHGFLIYLILWLVMPLRRP